MSFRVLLFVSLSALFVLGCRPPLPPLACPQKGGADWMELTSTHVVVRTDAEPAEARRLIVEYERLHRVLAYVLRRPRSVEGAKVVVVHFGRKEDFSAIVDDPQMGAFFTDERPDDIEPEPTIVAQAEYLPEDERETFLHELTHRFLHERFGALPVWLNEGLAKYYETLRVDEGRVLLGATGNLDFSDQPWAWVSWRGRGETTQIPRSKAPTVWWLVNSERQTFYDQDNLQRAANYAAAFKLVQYLQNGSDADRARFGAFLTAMLRGERARDAFLTVFEVPRLEPAFRRFLLDPPPALRMAVYREDTTPPPVAERTMSDAEVHLLWARLLRGDKASTARVRKQLDEALELDPVSPEVRYRRASFFLHRKELDDAERELAVALAKQPEEPRYLLAQLLLHKAHAKARRSPAGERVPDELVDHLERRATSAFQICAVADFERLRGRIDDGLRWVERALAADPLVSWCQEVRAKLLAEAGRFDEALAAVERAIALLPERTPVDRLLALRREIEQKRREALAGAGPSP